MQRLYTVNSLYLKDSASAPKQQGKQVLSKRGNGYLRKVLFQIGWSLMMHHEEYQRAYQEMRAGRKNYKTRIIALHENVCASCSSSIGSGRSRRRQPHSRFQ